MEDEDEEVRVCGLCLCGWVDGLDLVIQCGWIHSVELKLLSCIYLFRIQDEVVVFGSSGGGSSIVPPLPVQPLQQQPQGPVAVSGVATAMGGQQQQRQQQRQQQQQQHGGEEEEEDVLFSRVDSGGTGGAGNVGAQASSTTHRMV